ncbi:MAG: hypothetical protein MIL41_25025 [Hyphomicrobiales bacterium]|jgi:hypothetical protein
MPRTLFVVQNKGGVGKSLLTRALAEAAPDVAIFEFEVGERLLELGERVRHFEGRVDQAKIDATGGVAANREFVALIDAIAASEGPVVVDVGANITRHLITALKPHLEALADIGQELGFLVVANSDALSLAQEHVSAVKVFADATFVVHNPVQPDEPPIQGNLFGKGVSVTALPDYTVRLQAKGVELVKAGGLAGIPELDPKKLRAELGFSDGGTIYAQLKSFRLDAMRAVRPAAEWVVG